MDEEPPPTPLSYPPNRVDATGNSTSTAGFCEIGQILQRDEQFDGKTPGRLIGRDAPSVAPFPVLYGCHREGRGVIDRRDFRWAPFAGHPMSVREPTLLPALNKPAPQARKSIAQRFSAGSAPTESRVPSGAAAPQAPIFTLDKRPAGGSACASRPWSIYDL